MLIDSMPEKEYLNSKMLWQKQFPPRHHSFIF